MRNCSGVGFAAAMVSIGPAAHHTKGTPCVIGKVGESMNGIFGWRHQFWKWKWSDTMLALRDGFLPNYHTVKVGVLFTNFAIEYLFFKAAASPLSNLGRLKAKSRAYRKVINGNGFPA